MLVFTWRNVWTCWQPGKDSAMVWGLPQWGPRWPVTWERPSMCRKGNELLSWQQPAWRTVVTYRARCRLSHTSVSMAYQSQLRILAWLEAVVPSGEISFPHEWRGIAFEGYPGLCQTTDKTGSPNIKVWDQDPCVAGDLFWSSPVHLVIERIWNLSLWQESCSFLWLRGMQADTQFAACLFFFIKCLCLKTGKVLRIQSYWINDILNYLLISSHHLRACVFLITRIHY